MKFYIKNLNSFYSSLFFLMTILAFELLGCSNNVDSHEHTFSTEWTYNENYHWHVATCEHSDQVKDKLEHIFEEPEITEPTLSEDGLKIYTCKICKNRSS